MQIEKNKENNEKNKSEIDKIHAICQALEAKSVEVEDGMSELKSDTEAVRMNLSLSNGR